MIPEANPVDLAIQALGDLETLATFLGVSQEEISVWQTNREFPLEQIEKVYRVTQIPLVLLLTGNQWRWIAAKKKIQRIIAKR
jgi:hypothetical protein